MNCYGRDQANLGRNIFRIPEMPYESASRAPDRDFYYLVGLRFERGGEYVERSFWANASDGERAIWENCLRELKAIGNAQIVSYGAYETRFLRQMRARYTLAPDDWSSSIGSSERRSISLAAFMARFISRRFRTASKKSADTLGSSGPGRRLLAPRRHHCGEPGSLIRTMGSNTNSLATTWTTAEQPRRSWTC
jgi:hypothetical protein